MNPLIQLKTTSRLSITLVLACFALSQRTHGVVPPPPGGYPNFTTAAGDHALQALTLGAGNTGLGTFSLFSVTTGSFNTAVGAGALDLNTADSNTATGAAALLFNTTGTQNTASGTAALESNQDGSNNTANGAFALFSNTTGEGNTAMGSDALRSNTIGNLNTATGVGTLHNNTQGHDNTADGAFALVNNTGDNNTAVGSSALFFNTSGAHNTAIGFAALPANTGDGNVAIGSEALNSNTSGSFNVAIAGGRNLTTGIFNIAIGNDGVAGESNTTRIGILQNRCFISGIRDVTTGVADAVNVVIDSAGQLGTVSSSRRFKSEIKPMDKASEAILALKPVTFHYKSDHTARPQFGLIAEEVAEVNADLVVRDKDGEIYSVRYDQVNAMLLNEFLIEHRTVGELKATVAQQQKQIEALTAGLQRVSAQLETSKPAHQLVKNSH